MIRLGEAIRLAVAGRCAGKAPKATGDVLDATTVALFERALRIVETL